MLNRIQAALAGSMILLATAGCGSIPTSKPLAPDVKVAHLEIVKLGLMSQELAFTLEVFNPNNYDLPVNTLKFVASVANESFAQGLSEMPVLLSANSETEVVINVTTRASKLLKRLMSSSFNVNSVLDYNVTGFVKLDNWPARIPFNVDKTLSLDGS
ncbi:MAG: LEA type 2 family protein [Granulosicoccus sp.]